MHFTVYFALKFDNRKWRKILDYAGWILVYGYWTLDNTGCWMLDTGYWLLDNTGCWALDTGYWILNAGCWMLDKTGLWILDTSLWILNTGYLDCRGHSCRTAGCYHPWLGSQLLSCIHIWTWKTKKTKIISYCKLYI